MTNDLRERQSLQDQLRAVAVKLAKVQHQVKTAKAGLATIAEKRRQAQPMLINGHADQAQLQLDKLDAEERRLQRLAMALQEETSRHQREIDGLQANINEVEIRIAQRERLERRSELAAEVHGLKQKAARVELELQSLTERCSKAERELFELDKAMREEQWLVTQQRAKQLYKQANPQGTPGFERTINVL